MEYALKLDKFSGPLELLYELVKSRKIEISEISLARVTEQYLSYLERMDEYDLELVSEFLVIAAELIEIKIRRLLPAKSQEEDTGDDDESNLVNRLKQYHLFKQLSSILGEYHQEASQLFSRPGGYQEILEGEEPVLDLDLDGLVAAFKSALSRTEDEKEPKKEEEKPAGRKIVYPEVKIEDKSNYIRNKLKQRPRGFVFSELIEDPRNRLEIVVTFLAILELARMCQIRINQDRLFARIKLSGEGNNGQVSSG